MDNEINIDGVTFTPLAAREIEPGQELRLRRIALHGQETTHIELSRWNQQMGTHLVLTVPETQDNLTWLVNTLSNVAQGEL